MMSPHRLHHRATRLAAGLLLSACASLATADTPPANDPPVSHGKPAATDPRTPAPVLLRVGPVPIQCARAPCPTHSIAPVPPDGPPPSGVILIRPRLFHAVRPPVFEASAQDRARLEAAWQAPACLVVEGWLEDRTLRVQRIVSDCAPDQR